MRMVGADHITAAASGDAMLLMAIPVLWVIGVVVFVALKFRSR